MMFAGRRDVESGAFGSCARRGGPIDKNYSFGVLCPFPRGRGPAMVRLSNMTGGKPAATIVSAASTESSSNSSDAN